MHLARDIDRRTTYMYYMYVATAGRLYFDFRFRHARARVRASMLGGSTRVKMTVRMTLRSTWLMLVPYVLRSRYYVVRCSSMQESNPFALEFARLDFSCRPSLSSAPHVRPFCCYEMHPPPPAPIAHYSLRCKPPAFLRPSRPIGGANAASDA